GDRARETPRTQTPRAASRRMINHMNIGSVPADSGGEDMMGGPESGKGPGICSRKPAMLLPNSARTAFAGCDEREMADEDGRRLFVWFASNAAFTSGRFRTTSDQIPIGRPRSQAGLHGSSAKSLASLAREGDFSCV